MRAKTAARDMCLWLGMFTISIILGATIYQMIVVVPEFSRDIPNGMIELAKGHIQTKSFWASPLLPAGFVIVILALILNWKTPRKKWLLFSVALIILGEVLTDIFVYPNLKIMGIIDGNPSPDRTSLIKAIREWVIADHLRCWFFLVPAYFFFLKAVSVSSEDKISAIK